MYDAHFKEREGSKFSFVLSRFKEYQWKDIYFCNDRGGLIIDANVITCIVEDYVDAREESIVNISFFPQAPQLKTIKNNNRH
jgi:hypothetical protein